MGAGPVAVMLSDVIRIMEEIAPPRLAETWDNTGLQIGGKDQPVSRVWVALDPSVQVVSAACQNKVDLLITHHPLIFNPIRSIDFSSPIGIVIRMAASHPLAIYSAHTNLDSVSGGINDLLAQRIGLKNITVLGREIDPGSGEGIGRIGRLENPIPITAMALSIKKSLGATGVRVVAPPDSHEVDYVALCSGSGASLLPAVYSSGADVFVTGDFRYHDARDALERGVGIIDIGHFASEHLVVDLLTEKLRCEARQQGMAISVEACQLESDPFSYL